MALLVLKSVIPNLDLRPDIGSYTLPQKYNLNQFIML